MKEIHDSKCPLCDTDASFEFRDAKNIKLFDCPQCTNYFISIRAEKQLPHSFNRKSNLAKLAAEMKGKTNILDITLVQEDLHVSEALPTKYRL